jgi:fatty-acid desaturase
MVNASSRAITESKQLVWIAIHAAMHAAALYALSRFSMLNLSAMIVAHYFIMLFGITLGYHRLISHRSYIAPSWLAFFFGFMGVLAFQGGPRFWAAVHRSHHSKVNRAGDAHSASRGFWWSHMVWLFHREPNGFTVVANRHMVRDLTASKGVMFLERNFLLINLFVAALAFSVLPFDLWLWLFPVRIVFTWHTTWLVNSVAHGQLPFWQSQSAEPKNNSLVSFFTCGEGLHLNHHNSPNSPTFEAARGDFDFAYRFLAILAKLTLVKFRN